MNNRIRIRMYAITNSSMIVAMAAYLTVCINICIRIRMHDITNSYTIHGQRNSYTNRIQIRSFDITNS